MGEWSNVSVHASKNTLYTQEIDAILAILAEVMRDCYGGSMPRTGSFILDGQRVGAQASCIIKFNLAGGESYYNIAGREVNSLALAAQSIDELLSWPRRSEYYYLGDPLLFGKLPTDIYEYGKFIALVINTTYGRFLASLQTCRPDGGNDRRSIIRVLLSLVEVLRQLGQEDLVLQMQSRTLLSRFQSFDYKEVINHVQELFATCHLPALKTWHEWHELANASGELGLFFA